ncbi:hypothetical protein IW261DRAFT_1631432 [Armillaria novae-zelandiae]|uniref:F-box domain-containing protein n=1 Tax=Armillaria novae-zelandiae TaxID=153914 RepID=A0AA39TJP8_9AGAR|nr:hypothetical protein IW261DRAFT_1631432 [Armillaria novae-zelandiae]
MGILSSATINFASIATLGTFVGLKSEDLYPETLFTILTVVVSIMLSLPISTVVFNTFSSLDLYCLAFPKDWSFIRYLIYSIYAAEFGQAMLVTHDVFLVFGYGFGDILIGSPFLSRVQLGFYAYQILALSRSQTVSAFVICVSLTSSVAGIIAGVYSFQAGDITQLGNQKIFITFRLMRSNTGFCRTQMLITKLICLTIEMGSVTAIVALLTFILFYAFPHDTFYGVPAVMMTKLYANTLYVMLNSRIRIMGRWDTYTSIHSPPHASSQVVNLKRQAKLSMLPTLPLDILFEIFRHLHPLDLLHLTHTTKEFWHVHE